MSLPRILVVDDSLTSRTLVQIAFKGQPVSLDFAVSGQDGLQRAAQAPPQLILLDYMLPDMRGSAFCQLLQAQGVSAEVPVLVISAKEQGLQEAFAGCRNVAGYLGKPFTAAEVLARAQSLLARPAAVPGSAMAGSSAPSPAASSPLSHVQKQALAQAIYGVLRPQLQAIPQWMAELGTAAPAPFFAAKILTPERIDALVVALLPLLPVAALASAAVDAAAGERVYVRAPGFSSRVQGAGLGSREQRLLSAMDGRQDLSALAVAAGLPLTQAAAAAQGLMAAGLVDVRAGDPIKILVVAPLSVVWAAGLRAVCQAAMPPLPLTWAATPEAALPLLGSLRPALIWVAAALGDAALSSLASAAQAQTPASLRLVFVDQPAVVGASPLAWQAAYDAVLHAPLVVDEFEQLILGLQCR